RKLAQIMHATMDVGVLFGVITRDRVNHDLRFLRGRGAVQIDQWAPVNLLVENRKVLANTIYIIIHNWIGSGLHRFCHSGLTLISLPRCFGAAYRESLDPTVRAPISM